jgi:uncharacterized membrane protein
MEELFFEAASLVALCIEGLAVLVLALAATAAGARLIGMAIARETVLAVREKIWLKFGVAIALALEFALAADIIRSAIAPSWDAIGKLAAIAVIRTLLNVFLMRDLESIAAKQSSEGAT